MGHRLVVELVTTSEYQPLYVFLFSFPLGSSMLAALFRHGVLSQ